MLAAERPWTPISSSPCASPTPPTRSPCPGSGPPTCGSSRKPDRTPVTDADTAAEDALRGADRRGAPGRRGARRGARRRRAPTAGRGWVLDPIDGTKNFSRGMPAWATPDRAHRATASRWSGWPARRRWAGAGGRRAAHGAWTSATRPAQPRGGSPCPGVARAGRRLPVHHRPADLRRSRAGCDSYLRLVDACWETRAFGDFWQHCLVAEGVLDLAVDPAANPWDLAALVPILAEAGGRAHRPRRAPRHASPAATALRHANGACSHDGRARRCSRGRRYVTATAGARLRGPHPRPGLRPRARRWSTATRCSPSPAGSTRSRSTSTRQAGKASIFGAAGGVGLVHRRAVDARLRRRRARPGPPRSAPRAARRSPGRRRCSPATSCARRWRCWRRGAPAAARSWAWSRLRAHLHRGDEAGLPQHLHRHVRRPREQAVSRESAGSPAQLLLVLLGHVRDGGVLLLGVPGRVCWPAPRRPGSAAPGPGSAA